MTKVDLGILGGGQLARMLALEAFPLGVSVSVLTPQAKDPAAQVVGQTQLGSLSDEADLRRFMSTIQALTFESEFVDIPKLSRCLPDSVYVFPNLKAIEVIQDRLTQKQLLDRFQIPTSPWLPVENKNEFTTAIDKFPKASFLNNVDLVTMATAPLYSARASTIRWFCKRPSTDLSPKNLSILNASSLFRWCARATENLCNCPWSKACKKIHAAVRSWGRSRILNFRP